MFLSICIFLYRTGQRADPNELRRQRQRERYTLNKDEINRKRREARQLKTDKAANLNRKPTPSITPVGISPGMLILPLRLIQSGVSISLWCTSQKYDELFMSVFHTPCDATGQSAVTKLHDTPTTNTPSREGDPTQGCGLHTPVRAFNSLGNVEHLLLTTHSKNANWLPTIFSRLILITCVQKICNTIHRCRTWLR